MEQQFDGEMHDMPAEDEDQEGESDKDKVFILLFLKVHLFDYVSFLAPFEI